MKGRPSWPNMTLISLAYPLETAAVSSAFAFAASLKGSFFWRKRLPLPLGGIEKAMVGNSLTSFAWAVAYQPSNVRYKSRKIFNLYRIAIDIPS